MRLRFTIRDLLWLAVAVALAVGWWIGQRRIERRLENMEGAIRMMDANNRARENAVDYLLRQSGLSPKPGDRQPVLP
jgi:hypothetical protein